MKSRFGGTSTHRALFSFTRKRYSAAVRSSRPRTPRGGSPENQLRPLSPAAQLSNDLRGPPLRQDRAREAEREGGGDPILAAIALATRAPSSHNSQPWRYRLLGSGIEMHADFTRALPVVDPERRELHISCGAALFQLIDALQHFGYCTRLELQPAPENPALLARVRWDSRAATNARASLVPAIARRQTHRGPFLPRALPRELSMSLQAAARAEGASLRECQSKAYRTALAELVDQGDRLQWSNPQFRRELSSWLRPNTSKQGDGLPGYAFGYGAFTSRVAPWVVRSFDLGVERARTDRSLTLAAPLLCVLCSDRDEPRAWLAVGRALAHILLSAAAVGVSAGFMNQPVQSPSLRAELNRLLERPGFAQLVLRFGYAKLERPTSRRALADVVVSAQTDGTPV